MQEDASSCRHPYHEAKNGVLSPVFCLLTGESSSCSFPALLRQECAFLWHASLPFLRLSFSRFFLLFPSFRSSLLLSFFLLPAFFQLLVFFFFLFSGKGGGDLPFRLR